MLLISQFINIDSLNVTKRTDRCVILEFKSTYIYILYLIQKVGNTITPLTLGTTILANDHSKYVVTGTYNLTIVNVQISDEGTYQCVVGVTTREASLQTVGK
jgi:hypothetical protein